MSVEFGSEAKRTIFHDGKPVGYEKEVRQSIATEDMIDAHAKIFDITANLLREGKVRHDINVCMKTNKAGRIHRIEVEYTLEETEIPINK